MSTRWRVEPDADAHAVHLHHETDSGVSCYKASLDASEAWDLGDDLIIAANDLIPWEPVGFTTLPPWVDKIQVAVANGRVGLVCDDHGLIEFMGMAAPLKDIQDVSRTHWNQQHSAKEVDSEERSDGRSDEEVRSGDEAASSAPDVHDPAA